MSMSKIKTVREALQNNDPVITQLVWEFCYEGLSWDSFKHSYTERLIELSEHENNDDAWTYAMSGL